MAKTNLAEALERNKEDEVTAKAEAEAERGKPTSREGQVNVSAWFPINVRFTLDELRLKRQRELGRRVTIQELMGEAYNDLFKKYGLPEIAPSYEG